MNSMKTTPRAMRYRAETSAITTLTTTSLRAPTVWILCTQSRETRVTHWTTLTRVIRLSKLTQLKAHSSIHTNSTSSHTHRRWPTLSWSTIMLCSPSTLADSRWSWAACSIISHQTNLHSTLPTTSTKLTTKPTTLKCPPITTMRSWTIWVKNEIP